MPSMCSTAGKNHGMLNAIAQPSVTPV
jgi:hypothetical protein